MKSITVLGNRVLAEMKGANIKKSKGGLIIPDGAETATPQSEKGYATIIAIGDEVVNKSIISAFKSGKRIYVGGFVGVKMTYDGKEYQLLHVPDIFAIV